MSEIKITIQNDNKDEQKSNLSEQASADTSVYMHASQNEEKDVCRSVLYKEEEHAARGEELDANVKADKSSKDAGIFGKDKEYIVCFDFGRQGQNQGAYPQQGYQGPYQPPGPPYPPPYGAQAPYGSQPPYGPQGPYPPQGFYGQPPQWPGSGQQETNPRPHYNTGPPLDYSEGTEDRNAFVRKVTIIVFIMLCVTATFVSSVFMVDDIKEFFVNYRMAFLIVSMIGLIFMSCVMPTAACARSFPTNFICLVLVVIFQSLFCAVITCIYKTHIIVQALLATLAVVGVCVILACTSFDFTKLILYVIAIGVAFSVLSIIIMISMLVFNLYSKPLMIALVFGLTLLSVVTLIIDLQMVLGGKSVELSEQDYALGAFMLYTSVIDVFIKMLILMQLADS